LGGGEGRNYGEERETISTNFYTPPNAGSENGSIKQSNKKKEFIE
jgi:hypothetical protein